jgi:hypothetical protein
MGSGKTTIGRRIAPPVGRPFHDSDDGIEARTGRSARELKDELGEDAMHALEADDLLAGSDPQTFIAEQLRRRGPLFGSVQPVTVDIEDRSKEEIVAVILEALGVG